MKAGTTVRDDGTVEIMIPLTPYTKKNSQEIRYKRKRGGGKVPFISPSENYKQYESDCFMFMKPLNIGYPVNIEAKFYMPTRRRVDLTNLNEAIHDILSNYGVLQDDNASIVVSTDGSRVYYDKENPRTELLITKEEQTFFTAQQAKDKEKPKRQAKSAKKITEKK